MKKELFELTSHEFAAVLLGISPSHRIKLHLESEGDSLDEEFVGTYDELMSQFIEQPELAKQLDAMLFDYDMALDETDAMRYIRHRTDDFSPELTRALYQDIDLEEFVLFDEVEGQYKDREKYNLWKDTSTYSFYKIKNFLKAKVDEYEKKGLLLYKIPTVMGITGCGECEVDRLLSRLTIRRKSYNISGFDDDVKTFKRVCIKKARGSQDRAQKEQWIMDVATTLDEVFAKAEEQEKAAVVNQSAKLFVAMEAAFMSAPNPICVKDLCIQLNLNSILDKEIPDERPEGFPSRASLGLCPMTLEEMLLQKELGDSCTIKQKDLCKDCKVKPCKYQFGRKRFYLMHDDEYDEAIGEKKWATAALMRALSYESIDEIVTNTIHSISKTPLQEIQSIFQHKYWIQYIEAFLRKVGDPKLRIDDDEQHELRLSKDDSILLLPPADVQVEYKRWRPLYDSFSDVIQRNENDIIAIKKYFTALITPLRCYSNYFFPDRNNPELSKCSRVLLKIAVSDITPGLGQIWSNYPDALYETEERRQTEPLSEEQYDDILYRSLYEKLKEDRKDDLDRPLHMAVVILDLLQKFAAVIDKVLRHCSTGLCLGDIQKESGVVLIEDTSVIDVNYKFYWEDDESYYNAELGANVSNATRVNGGDTATTSSSDIKALLENKDLMSFLTILREAGYLNEDYSWNSDKGTNYHAAWASRFITKSLKPIKHKHISAIFGIANINTYVTEAGSKGSVTSVVEKLFTDKGLPIPW